MRVPCEAYGLGFCGRGLSIFLEANGYLYGSVGCYNNWRDVGSVFRFPGVLQRGPAVEELRHLPLGSVLRRARNDVHVYSEIGLTAS